MTAGLVVVVAAAVDVVEVCREVHLEPLYAQQCAGFHIRNSWKRAARSRTTRFHLVGSYASREPIAASDSAADAD